MHAMVLTSRTPQWLNYPIETRAPTKPRHRERLRVCRTTCMWSMGN
jgi:hypothetical protein